MEQIRTGLYDTFMDYAKQAEERHEWEAATAYRRAAEIALTYWLRADTENQPRN